MTMVCPTSRPILHSVRPVCTRETESLDSYPQATASLLLIDANSPRMSEPLRRALVTPGYDVQVATAGAEGLEHLRAESPDLVVLCLGSCTPSEMEIYRQIRRINARVPIIFVALTGRAEAAIEAMKQGAYDFLYLPMELAVLQRVVAEALEVGRGMRRPHVDVEIQSDTVGDGTLVGCCVAMRDVYKAIGRVAPQNMPVLITGESGTGKELVARAIQQHSSRSDKPFIAINCAAIPESLLESELFGHEKGAFTGADRRRVGKFEQCNGGTILLDEIGDMPPSLQAKMLRLLQDQTFERVGGNETIQTDVRVIAATNRDLRTLSEQGKFRPDLYYRLGVFTLPLPPLRERSEDLPVLLHHFLRLFNRELNRHIREISTEAMERLRAYQWPGNIRELQSVVKQSLLRATGSVLLPAFLPALSSDEDVQASMRTAECTDGWSAFKNLIQRRLEAGSTDLSAEAQLEIDRLLLPTVLGFTDNNQFQAAKILGLARQTLRQRLRSIGFNIVKSFGDEPAQS